MANGIIIIDKPEGWTSQDVTARLRRVFKTKRIGHGGTLDPMATGVLPVFVGRATRAVEFFEHAQKEYIATLRLGLLTDTEDISGRILEQRPVTVTRAEVEAVLSSFLGEQDQIPPMYSAIKVNGQKLYQLARAGKEVERQPRRITVYELELLGEHDGDYEIRVACSKGTYIRTLCKDIGMALGCGGCMAALRRSRAGEYSLKDAVNLAQLLEKSERGEDVEGLLLPVESMFAAYPAIRLSQKQEKCVRNGASFSYPAEEGDYRLYAGTEFLALGHSDGKVMSTTKSFFEVNGSE